MHPSRTVALALLAGALFVGTLTACEEQPTYLGSDIAPQNGALWGSFLQPGTRGRAEQRAQIRNKEQFNGRRFGLLHGYEQWRTDLPQWNQREWSNSGRVPMISWDSPRVTRITNGSQDAHIDRQPRGLRDWGRDVMLRFFWEMDGNINSDRAVNPPTYKAAWRRVVNRFRAQGADNVEFVWCPTAWGFATGDAQRWYPGDKYVDWLCADGYNWGFRRPGDEWREFGKIYLDFFDWAEQRPKPIVIGEFASGEDPNQSGRKAQWLLNARNHLKRDHPKVKAVVYFDGGTGRTDFSGSWLTTTSWSSRNAWRNWGSDPYYRQFNAG